MNLNHRLSVLIIGYFAVASIAMTGEAGASIIYNWTGVCDFGCTGQSTARLVLKDTYTPGTQFNDTDFIEFEYHSTSGFFNVPGNEPLLSAVGTLPLFAGQSQPSVEILFGSSTLPEIFFAGPGDQWGVSIRTIAGDIPEDGGFGYVWQREVPEPGSLGIVGLGLAALGFVGWRRSRRRQA